MYTARAHVYGGVFVNEDPPFILYRSLSLVVRAVVPGCTQSVHMGRWARTTDAKPRSKFLMACC